MWIIIHIFRITTRESFISKAPTELSSDNSGISQIFRVIDFCVFFNFIFYFLENTGKSIEICLGTKPEKL